jgi:hypothetical protein
MGIATLLSAIRELALSKMALPFDAHLASKIPFEKHDVVFEQRLYRRWCVWGRDRSVDSVAQIAAQFNRLVGRVEWPGPKGCQGRETW